MARQTDTDEDRQDGEAGRRFTQGAGIAAVSVMLLAFMLWVVVQMAPATVYGESLAYLGIGFLLLALGVVAYGTVQKLISDS